MTDPTLIKYMCSMSSLMTIMALMKTGQYDRKAVKKELEKIRAYTNNN